MLDQMYKAGQISKEDYEAEKIRIVNRKISEARERMTAPDKDSQETAQRDFNEHMSDMVDLLAISQKPMRQHLLKRSIR